LLAGAKKRMVSDEHGKKIHRSVSKTPANHQAGGKQKNNMEFFYI
jgi:hypothetical protein